MVSSATDFIKWENRSVNYKVCWITWNIRDKELSNTVRNAVTENPHGYPHGVNNIFLFLQYSEMCQMSSLITSQRLLKLLRWGWEGLIRCADSHAGFAAVSRTEQQVDLTDKAAVDPKRRDSWANRGLIQSLILNWKL